MKRSKAFSYRNAIKTNISKDQLSRSDIPKKLKPQATSTAIEALFRIQLESNYTPTSTNLKEIEHRKFGS